MKKYLFSIIILLLIIFAGTKFSLACTCELQLKKKSLSSQVKKAYKESAAVFSGEVLSIKKVDAFNLQVKFKVDKSWKNNSTNEVLITTGLGGGDCGFSFEVGKKYIVYAYGDTANLSAGICSRTALLETSNDVKILDGLNKKKS